MAQMNIILPSMGEGVIEATITKWLVKAGAEVKEDDPIVEVATDKVDSEIPAPSAGIISVFLVKEGSVVKVGETIAVLETASVAGPEEQAAVSKEVERIRETIREVREEIKTEQKNTSVSFLQSDILKPQKLFASCFFVNLKKFTI